MMSSGVASNWFLSHRGTDMVYGSYAPRLFERAHYKNLMEAGYGTDEENTAVKNISLSIQKKSVTTQQSYTWN